MKRTITFILISFSIYQATSQQITKTNNNMKNISESLSKSIAGQTFSELPYKYDALEPYFDKMTMEIHHSKHHKAYFDNMMSIVEKNKEFGSIKLIELFKNMSKYPVGLRNNAGGFYNHLLFWNLLSTDSKPLKDGKLKEAIVRDFGSYEQFKLKFEDAAKSRFGSGWAWLVLTSDKKLVITSTPNQDNPYMDVAEIKGTPIIALDVWEHAYYLKYQNRRADYVSAFWNVIDWEKAEILYSDVSK